MRWLVATTRPTMTMIPVSDDCTGCRTTVHIPVLRPLDSLSAGDSRIAHSHAYMALAMTANRVRTVEKDS
jgi:hypothetical protein